MQQIKHAIHHMINASESEVDHFLNDSEIRVFKKKEYLAEAGKIPNEIFFINRGILRVIVTDKDGTEHSMHFALENQFIADYASFILKEPSFQSLQALEETEVVVIPRSSIEWGYENLSEGDKLGRLIAEFYFIYQDHRIKNLYARSPKERYDTITEVFPDIHNRVPQHMIASYLGMTPVHLSRLKKEDSIKS